MAAPSETPKEMLVMLDVLLKDCAEPSEFQKRIYESFTPSMSKEDARRIVYGEPKKWDANPWH